MQSTGKDHARKKAFVIMPFTKKYFSLYESAVQPALMECGYTTQRADSVPTSQDLIHAIVRGIVEADLVLADVSEPNANVYYELGISHSLTKATILICQEPVGLPFNISPQHVLTYPVGKYGPEVLKHKLKHWVTSQRPCMDPLSNPVSAVLDSHPLGLKAIYRLHSELVHRRSDLNAFEKYLTEGPDQARNALAAERIADEILHTRPSLAHPAVVAITGSSGVGKSDFSRLVGEKIQQKAPDLTITRLGTDCYMMDRIARRQRDIVGFDPQSHDLQRLGQDVRELVAGRSIRVRPYDHRLGVHSAEDTREPAPVVIVEGVQAFCDLLIPITQGLRVFMHADREKVRSLKFIVDITKRGYGLGEAFTHADRENDEFEKHTLPHLTQANFVIRVVGYWTYEFDETWKCTV